MMMYLDLIFNLSLLVALSIVSGFIERRWSRQTRAGVLMQGLLFGGAAVLGMLRPLELGPGLIFDGRSIMVSLGAWFFGPWAAAVAGILPIVCRIVLGGPGTLMGVLVVLASAAIGLLAYFRFNPGVRPPSTGQIYLFGLTVHIAMLALTLTLPEGVWLDVLMRIGLPVMLTYPLATILAGKILSDQVAAIRTMAALQDSEKRYRRLFESAQDGILILDADTGMVVDANPFLSQLLGYSHKTFLGKHLWAIGPFKNVASSKDAFRDLQDKEYIRYDDLPLETADGQTIEVEFVSNVYRVDNAKVIYCNIRDITEQKKATTASLRAANEWQATFNSVNDAIWILDHSQCIRRSNKTAERFFGQPIDRMLGKQCWEVTHGSMGPVDGCPFLKSEMSLRRESMELQLGAGWFQVTTDPILDDAGRFSGAVHIVRDITQHKLAEDALGRYECIVSNTRDLLALINRNFIYLAANAAYLEAFGKTTDAVIGKSVIDLVGEKPFTMVIEPKARRCLAGEIIRYQEWFELPAAGRKYIDVVYSPYISPESEILGFVVSARDITEQEHLRVQFNQAQKMESVGRLAGGVAHDYNNMLSVIIGYTELALEKVDPSAPLHDDLTEVLNAAKRSSDITRQLLAFARKQTIAPKMIDVNETVESLLKMLQNLIGEDIDLAWLPESNVLPLKTDPTQIEQVLTNLLVNARDAIADVGKITIETHMATFDEAYCAVHDGFIPGEFVLLTVSDDGCGMDKETLDRIFEPFFTTKGNNQGTGLGLATVYGIVKQNEGFINVYSEPGKGTTFRIYLPPHEGVSEKTDNNPVRMTPKSLGEMILLVEDESAIRKMAQAMLERLGYQVLVAGTPGQALQAAGSKAGDIHLLITDVVMPDMNGRELADQLHALYPDMKILFMSGYTANVIAHRGVLDKGVNFIQKPFSVNDLAVKIREVLYQNQRDS